MNIMFFLCFGIAFLVAGLFTLFSWLEDCLKGEEE